MAIQVSAEGSGTAMVMTTHALGTVNKEADIATTIVMVVTGVAKAVPARVVIAMVTMGAEVATMAPAGTGAIPKSMTVEVNAESGAAVTVMTMHAVCPCPCRPHLLCRATMTPRPI